MAFRRTARLTCPKCGGSFDYEFVPGASFTAIRLGSSRYMRCPICQRFSVFKLSGTSVAPPAVGGGPPGA